ncbi:MAG: hypothetical protein SGI99_15005 [Pseudomonadota bacterium]|nr:hypothetical protein [Pseudomonadota bacterium]
MKGELIQDLHWTVMTTIGNIAVALLHARHTKPTFTRNNSVAIDWQYCCCRTLVFDFRVLVAMNKNLLALSVSRILAGSMLIAAGGVATAQQSNAVDAAGDSNESERKSLETIVVKGEIVYRDRTHAVL